MNHAMTETSFQDFRKDISKQYLLYHKGKFFAD